MIHRQANEQLRRGDDGHECRVVSHDVVGDVCVLPLGKFRKELPCAVDFGLFDLSKLHGGHGALSFRDEVHVLDAAGNERDRPVGVVVPYGRGNEKSSWQFRVDRDVGADVQVSGKGAFSL